MRQKEIKLLEKYLWELTKQIGRINNGLPLDWMQRRVLDLVDIFDPVIKKKKK